MASREFHLQLAHRNPVFFVRDLPGHGEFLALLHAIRLVSSAVRGVTMRPQADLQPTTRHATHRDSDGNFSSNRNAPLLLIHVPA